MKALQHRITGLKISIMGSTLPPSLLLTRSHLPPPFFLPPSLLLTRSHLPPPSLLHVYIPTVAVLDCLGCSGVAVEQKRPQQAPPPLRCLPSPLALLLAPSFLPHLLLRGVQHVVHSAVEAGDGTDCGEHGPRHVHGHEEQI